MKILSIIIPSYNMEEFLPYCLDSVLGIADDYRKTLEVIVVNDGSTDDTGRVAHEFKSRFPDSIVVIDKKNGNYGSCVNAALKVASGLYVKILDADDYVNTAEFESLVKELYRQAAMKEQAADLVLSNYRLVDNGGECIREITYGMSPFSGEFSAMSNVNQAYAIHSLIYKTNCVKRIGYIQTEGVSYTDMEWTVEPLVSISTIRYVPLFVTNYRQGRNGQTMEDKTYAQKFQQVADVVLNMVSRYSKMRDFAVSDAAFEIYKSQLVSRIKVIYRSGIFQRFRDIRVFDLVGFDHALRGSPELYEYAANFKAGLFRVKYVKLWRRTYNRHSLLLVLAFVLTYLKAWRNHRKSGGKQ